MASFDTAKRKILALLRSKDSNELKDKIGAFAVKLIQDRTRGKKKDFGGKPLAALAPKTIERRKFYQQYLHPGTRPRTSNLTMTGQLLDSLKYRYKGNSVFVFVPNTSRKPIKPEHKTPLVNNRQVAEYVQDRRPFMGLAPEDNKKILVVYDRELRLLVRRYLGG